MFEPLEAAHIEHLQEHSTRIINASLNYPAPNKNEVEKKVRKLSQPIWLIVHTSNGEELQILLDHAKDLARLEKKKPCFIVLSDQELSPREHIVSYFDENPVNWFPFADKIITAAGFNTLYQVRPYREKHICLPFIRQYDDQFWRTAYFKKQV